MHDLSPDAESAVTFGPQPGPQTIAIQSDADELIYGGAVGGGKTHFLMLDFLYHSEEWNNSGAINGLLLRKTYKELADILSKMREVMPRLGWHFKVGEYTWWHPNGGRLQLGYLSHEDDVDTYWGAEYCVGEGTPILMADGSDRAIEHIAVGDLVMTLEGPKRVTGLMPKRLANCVRAESFDSEGRKIGEQIQPWKHPVLTNVLATCEQSHHQFGNAEQLPQPSFPAWSSYEFLLDEHLKNLGNGAFLRGENSSDGAIEHSNLEIAQLPVLSCPAVLHVPSPQLCLSQRPYQATRLPIQFAAPSESPVPLSATEGDPLLRRSDPLRLGAPCPQHLSVDALNNVGDSPCELDDSETASGFPIDCSLNRDRRDARLLQASSNVEDGAPSLAGAASPVHAGSHGDDTDSTQQCIARSPALSYIHPYTTKLRDVVETVQIGSCKLTPVGMRVVYDLCVEDANHYITASRLVNKNTWLAVDELGQWKEHQFAWINKLKARLRSKHGVRCRFRATANPGGPGHETIKKVYIKPADPFTMFVNPETGMTCMFVPARFQDNQILMKADPNYLNRLNGAGPAWWVRAIKEGDWNVSPQGNVFVREYFNNRYQQLPERFDFHALSLDTAYKKGRQRSHSAIIGVGATKNLYYITYAWHDQVPFPQLKQKTKDTYARINPDAVWVENKASGISLVQELQDDSRMPIKEVSGDDDKMARAFATTALWDAGKVLLPASAPWVDDFIEEHCRYPDEPDDQVDATSQALTLLKKYIERLLKHRKVVPFTGSVWSV